jgi:hypothetical protein
MVAEPAAKVTRIEEGRERYGQSKDTIGFTQLPRELRQRCKKLNAGELYVLWEVLDRTVSWNRFTPQKITIREFAEASGLSHQTISDGIDGLVRRGLLYEERIGPRKTSSRRYAIIDASNPANGPYQTPEGKLVIHLLGGLVYPVVLESRTTKDAASCSKDQNNVVLESRTTPCSKDQNNVVLESRTKKSLETAPAQAPEATQERSKNVIEERVEEGAAVHQPPLIPVSDTGKAPARPARTSTRKPHVLPIATPAAADAEHLLAEAADLLCELRKAPGWEEIEGEAVNKLDTLLRVKQYPLAWLIDEAIAYGSYATKSHKHTWAGFAQWCNPTQNPIAGRHLDTYRARLAAEGCRTVPANGRSREEKEAEEARIVAEQLARSRARFARPEAHA